MLIRPINLAIADDHTLFRKILKKYLSEQKNLNVVLEASNASDVINQLKVYAVDILLMDIFMPGMDAIDAVTLIRKEHPAVKIIIVSMTMDVELVSNLLDCGIHGYVSKSDDTEALLQVIYDIANDKMCRNELFMEALYKNKQQSIKAYLSDSDGRLSERERKILQLLWKEKSNKEIANELFLGVRTVERIRQEMKEKFGTKSTLGLIKFAINKKVIPVKNPE